MPTSIGKFFLKYQLRTYLPTVLILSPNGKRKRPLVNFLGGKHAPKPSTHPCRSHSPNPAKLLLDRSRVAAPAITPRFEPRGIVVLFFSCPRRWSRGDQLL